MNPRTFRLASTILLALLVAAALVAFAVALSIPAQLEEDRREIACVSARANVFQLEALESIARTLGLPEDTVVVPDLPEECE